MTPTTISRAGLSAKYRIRYSPTRTRQPSRFLSFLQPAGTARFPAPESIEQRASARPRATAPTLFRISREPDAPAHTRIPRPFNTFRAGSRGWCRRDSSARVSAKSCARSPSASSFSRTASRSLRFKALKAVTKTSAVASVTLIRSTLGGMLFTSIENSYPPRDQSQRSSHRTALPPQCRVLLLDSRHSTFYLHSPPPSQEQITAN